MEKTDKHQLHESAQAHNLADPDVRDFLNSSFFTSPFIQKVFPPAVLVFLTTLIYLPSLYYPFQFDDIANISKRFGIRFDNPLERWWGSSRWLGDWLNIMNYNIGGFDPFSYRLINLIIHLVAGLFVFYLVHSLCSALKNRTFFLQNSHLLAFTTAGLFLLHPVQTQTVSYVIQARLEGLASLLVLAAVLSYVKGVSAQSWLVKLWYGIIFFAAAFLSCGTKELVVVMPVLLIIVDWFFISQQTWQQFKKRFLIHLSLIVSFIAVAVHYLGSKFAFEALTLKMVVGNNRGNILTPHAFDLITPWQFFISELRVFVHYIAMFFWPFNISVEYDWKIAPRFFSVDVLLPLMVLLPLVGMIAYAVKNKKYPSLAFGGLWFFVALAPRSTIVPSPELVCDYKTYLASVGILFIIAVGIVSVFRKILPILQNLSPAFHLSQAHVSMLTSLMLVVGSIAYQRNKVWESSVVFWDDCAKKAPGKARVHNNLGVALSEVGRLDESLVAYQKAIALDAHYADPLSNIAVAYSLKGDVDKAIDALKGAIHICPNYPEAYNNLGTLLLQKKLYDDAQRALEIAIQLRPYYGKAFYNLARMYEEKNDQQKSWEYLKKATEGDLDTPEVFFKFGQMCLRVQKYPEAIQAFEFALSKGFVQDAVHFNLANAYFMQGGHQQALDIYEKLVNNNPLEGKYAYNLAETYFTMNKFEESFEMFKKIMGLPQPVPQAFFRAVHCLERLQRVDDAKSLLNQMLTLNAADDFKNLVKSELARVDDEHKKSNAATAVVVAKNSIGLKGKETAAKKA